MSASESKLPFSPVPDDVLRRHKENMHDLDVRLRRLCDIQTIDGIDLMAMILEIEHYRSGAVQSIGATPGTQTALRLDEAADTIETLADQLHRAIGKIVALGGEW